jgi:hypothetical protein
MISVIIGANAFLSINVDEFLTWCKVIGISNQDWNFRDEGYVTGLTAPETFYFRHEEDAIAFRLKFGL